VNKEEGNGNQDWVNFKSPNHDVSCLVIYCFGIRSSNIAKSKLKSPDDSVFWTC